MLSKKFTWAFGLLVIASMVLAACGGGAVQTVVVTEVVEGEVVERVVTATPQPAAEEPVTVNINWFSEPPTLDPALTTDTTSTAIISSMFTAVTDIDIETKEAVPSLATSWESNEDGSVWTFHLRDDIPWVRYNEITGQAEVITDDEGNPRVVNAHDVVYAIKRALNPETGSSYAYILYPIAGAIEFNGADPEAEDFGELQDAVGVEALDDTTLQVSLEFGAGFWPQVMSMPNFSAVPQWAIEEHGERWVEPGFYVTNGAYTLEDWVHGDHLSMVKNPNWPLWGTDWAPGNIERIYGVMISDESTAFNLYENNDLDSADLPQDQIDAFSASNPDEFIQVPINCTYYYGFVTTKAPVDNPAVRRALSMAVDRVTLVEQVTRGGQIPANTFTNPLNFGTAAEDPSIAPWALTEEKGGTGYAAAVEQAKGLLAEAGFENGAGLDILLMHNVSEGHARIAQAIQAMWQEAFPEMTVSVETQEWAVYLDTIEATTAVEDVPHVFRLGWCGDYPHANNWLLEVFHPEEGANRTRMSLDDPTVAEYAELTKQAQTASETEAAQLYAQAEQLLVDDIAAIIPIYYYTEVQATKPWLDRTYDPIQLHAFQWTLDQAAKDAATQ